MGTASLDASAAGSTPARRPAWNGGPTRGHLRPPGLAPVLQHNIRALAERRQEEEARATWPDRMAEAVTRFTGSMTFVWLHLALFGFWIVANLGWVPGVPAWDESFVTLAMGASVEAIFLSTFVLISQNRMAAAADRRADLDLQISLLAEHEITRIATLLAAVAERLDVRSGVDGEMAEIGRDVSPEAVLDSIEAAGAERA